ncbi:methyltransferase [Nocardioides caeni]|uniref:Methyltransferase n=1 Tax=Nocardioides caeni TaxID=574700 RepID=A0A4S8N3Q1_9ACTN|nr:methyltransferase [Nocardioides caeni]THV10475.1 methyltransferase [Nocardioides caeni]
MTTVTDEHEHSEQSGQSKQSGEPAQQEVATFGRLEIAWDRRVLQPRPWTTAQSHWAAAVEPACPAGPVLELFCGAGQIGLLVAALTSRPLIQVDSDEVAASYARRNAEAAGITADVRTARVEDALAPEERVALVVVDPPWVPTDRVDLFPEDPESAIDGGPDGTTQLVPGLEVALDHLLPGGHVIAQVGSHEQVEQVRDLLDRLDRRGSGSGLVVRETRDYLPDGVLVHIGPPR